MKCEICGTELKALFTSNYCPNEDKHHLKEAVSTETLELLWNNELKQLFVNSTPVPSTPAKLTVREPLTIFESPLSSEGGCGLFYGEITYTEYSNVTVKLDPISLIWTVL